MQKYAGTYSTSETKQDYAQRRDQPECACPEGKSLPLVKAYPAAQRESMGAKMGAAELEFLCELRKVLCDLRG
jgi:hypothetical protein